MVVSTILTVFYIKHENFVEIFLKILLGKYAQEIAKSVSAILHKTIHEKGKKGKHFYI